MLECVVFDLDGLLVDSEPLQYHAYKTALERHGVHIDMSDWVRWHRIEASVLTDRSSSVDPPGAPAPAGSTDS